MEFDETRPPLDPALAATLATSDVLRRIAGTAAIHLYELRYDADGSYECTAFIGEGLESLLGAMPADVDEELAWEQAVHQEDRASYDAFNAACRQGEAAEIEFRLVGFDGVTRWVWERARPRVEDGVVWVDGVVADVTERRRAAGGAGAPGAPGLSRQPDRSAQPRRVPRAAGDGDRRSRPGRPQPGGAIHRPRRLQARERWIRPRRRRRAARALRRAAARGLPAGRPGRPPGRRRVPHPGARFGQRRARAARGRDGRRVRARDAEPRLPRRRRERLHHAQHRRESLSAGRGHRRGAPEEGRHRTVCGQKRGSRQTTLLPP